MKVKNYSNDHKEILRERNLKGKLFIFHNPGHELKENDSFATFKEKKSTLVDEIRRD